MKQIITAFVLGILLIFTSCQSSKEPESAITQEKGEDKPSEFEMKVNDRLEALLQKREGHPSYEETPVGLSRDQFKKWLDDFRARGEAYDNKQIEIVAEEFNITVDEVNQIYIKVTSYKLEKE